MPISWLPTKRTLEDEIEAENIRLQTARVAQIQKLTRTAPVWLPQLEEPQPAMYPFPGDVPMTAVEPTAFAVEPTIPTYEEAVAPSWTQPMMPPPVRQPMAPPIPVAPTTPVKQPVNWWEKPKEVYTGIEQKVGEAVSKVPLLPKALEKVAPVFEWIHNNLEKPFAATILSAFAPDVAWETGESWLSHQKRKYDAWDAPAYLKGVAEFAMPLWWVPYFGWAAKGAKALGVGERVFRGFAASEKIAGIPSKMITLPSDSLLNKVLFKENTARKFAQYASKVPGIKQAIELVGGPGVLLNPTSTNPLDIAKRSYIKNMGFVRSMGQGVENQVLPHLQVLGADSKVLGITSEGKITNIVAKAKGGSQYFGDVLEEALNRPDDFEYLNKAAKQYVDTYRTGLQVVNKLREEVGLPIPKEYKYHRMVEGKVIQGKFEKSDFGSRFDEARVHEKMADAIARIDPATGQLNGIVYGLSPNESLATTINHYVTQVAKKRFTDEVGVLGKTANEKWVMAFPKEAEQLDRLVKQLSSTKYAESALKRIVSYKGQSIPGAVIRKIREELPDAGKLLDDALELPLPDFDKIITSMGKEIRVLLKVSPKEFKIKVASAEGRTMLNKVESVLLAEAKDNIMAEQLIESIYKRAARFKKAEFNTAMTTVRDSVSKLLESSKGELKPLMAGRRDFLNHYKASGQIFGGEAKFRAHPVFRDKIFPEEVVSWVEKNLSDQGQRWLRDASTLSGISRMTTATLDMSAMFIQGASLIGRNPVAWAQSVGRMFQFAASPKRFLEYLTDPAIVATRAERIAAGGSAGGFEFFQALKPLQAVAGKVPKVGGIAQKGIQEVFGRAEVLFEGFGEVARNKLWAAMRKPGATPEKLMDLARSLDRMTGVMSTGALGVGKTQQDFESAFMFFSPRYTRAGLSLVGDALQGGLAGAEARKAIGMFLEGGFSMYYGACKALGQQPDFNPKSGRFLTVKVGNQHLGIGGISIAMMRLLYDIGVTAVEDPTNLVKPFNETGINRWDNPFVKFMYSRTAPLTSLGVGLAIEQADYLGQPFENIGDYGRFLLDKVTPIALQGVAEAGVIGTAGQLAGLRQFPKSPFELLDEERDRIAKSNFRNVYDNLTDLEKMQINKSPTVMKLQDDVDARTLQTGSGESLEFLKRKSDMDDARQSYVGRLFQLQNAYDAGVINGFDFKEEMSKVGYGMGATYEFISTRPEYKKVMDKLQSADMPDKTRFDLARIEFAARSNSPEMEDAYGIFDYKKYDTLIQEIRSKYGEDAYQYILEYKAERDKELPPLAQAYQRAKEILKPYWAVADKVAEIFGKSFAESSKGQSFITKQRKMMRLTNTEIAKYYDLFYKRV